MATSKLYLKRDSSIDVFLWIVWIIQEYLFCRGSTIGWFWNTTAGVSIQTSCKPDGLSINNKEAVAQVFLCEFY